MKNATIVSGYSGNAQSPSFAPAYECPACGTEFNRETAQAKGLYCGCSPLVYMRRVRP